jgi:hypothetical protein
MSAWGAQAQTSASAQTTASPGAQGAGPGQAGVQTQSSSSASASRTSESSSRNAQGKQRSATTSASASNSNSASAGAGPAAIELDHGTTVNAVLVKPVDARKCKPGDKIEARTTSDVKQDGRVVLRKGSRLYGHITEAQARSKRNAESSLGMAFDSATLKNGEQVPLHLGVQALAAASSETTASLADDEPMISSGASGVASGSGRAGGGLLGGAGGTVGGATGAAGAVGGVAGNASGMAGGTLGATTNATESAAGEARELDAGGHLMSTSSGVFGLQGLNLTSAASNATEGSVVTSTTRNVHLDSGTQMLLSASKQ